MRRTSTPALTSDSATHTTGWATSRRPATTGNRSYAYKLNQVSCVPGDYRATGYGFANLNGGQPDITKRVTTRAVAVSCD